mmetsp:Transcript_50589/g.134649  ORF Transcript_50589/g.134649 Transcript_50589/m.134649 type:complete len:233 (+) Transcript_50589:684-1382(+)
MMPSSTLQSLRELGPHHSVRALDSEHFGCWKQLLHNHVNAEARGAEFGVAEGGLFAKFEAEENILHVLQFVALSTENPLETGPHVVDCHHAVVVQVQPSEGVAEVLQGNIAQLPGQSAKAHGDEERRVAEGCEVPQHLLRGDDVRQTGLRGVHQPIVVDDILNRHSQHRIVLQGAHQECFGLRCDHVPRRVFHWNFPKLHLAQDPSTPSRERSFATQHDVRHHPETPHVAER